MDNRSDSWEFRSSSGDRERLSGQEPRSDLSEAERAARIEAEMDDRLDMLMKAHVAMLEERNTYQDILLEIAVYLQHIPAHELSQQDRDIRQVLLNIVQDGFARLPR